MLATREPHLPPRGHATLADLYDPLSMPTELLRAHEELDRAVEKCYRSEPFHSDRERVEFLFSLYLSSSVLKLLTSSTASASFLISMKSNLWNAFAKVMLILLK